VHLPLSPTLLPPSPARNPPRPLQSNHRARRRDLLISINHVTDHRERLLNFLHHIGSTRSAFGSLPMIPVMAYLFILFVSPQPAVTSDTPPDTEPQSALTDTGS
jgi:hypothetical protein